MVKIADTKQGRTENSGYIRLFGNVRMGLLMSKVHATVIRSGNDLEVSVWQRVSDSIKTMLESIFSIPGDASAAVPVQVIYKPKMPKSEGKRGSQADLVILDHSVRRILVIELKDGDTFDTKKSSGELESLKTFSAWMEKTHPGYTAQFFFCSFNQDDKNAIVRGAKNRFGIENAMTGRELCNLIGVDYDSLIAERQSDQPENLRYFLTELLKIPEIRSQIIEIMEDQV